MALTWVRVSPPVNADGATLEWAPVGGANHYALLDEGLDSPNDADYIRINNPDKTDEMKIPAQLAGTEGGFVRRVKVGFRYEGIDHGQSPNIAFELWLDGTQYGNTLEYNAEIGTITDAQAEFFVNIPVADYAAFTTRLLKIISKGENGGASDPPVWDFFSEAPE